MSQPVPDAAETLLEKARAKAEAAEVTYEEAEHHSASFQSNRLKYVKTKVVRGLGLRVIHNGRLGHTSTTDLDDIGETVRRALESARFGQEARFQFPASCDPADVVLLDPATQGLAPERAIETGKEAVERVLSEYPDADCSAEVEWSWGRRVLVNSDGLRVEECGTHGGLGITALRVVGDSLVWAGEDADGRAFRPEAARLSRQVCRWLRMAEREVVADTERLPVLFTPKRLDLLLASFEANLNAKTVQKGLSLLADKIGQCVADPRITWRDDPLVDLAEGSFRVDAEGLPARRKLLIDRGVLCGFVNDLQTAGMLGVPPTGNAAGGFDSMPAPGFANVRLSPGSAHSDDLLRSLRRGVLVDEVMGDGQGNVLSGDFSVNLALAFLVEGGEVVGRIKNAMLAGNAFDALNRLGELSSDTEWHGDAELPAALIPDLSVVGK
jgi:PmbA protein